MPLKVVNADTAMQALQQRCLHTDSSRNAVHKNSISAILK